MVDLAKARRKAKKKEQPQAAPLEQEQQQPAEKVSAAPVSHSQGPQTTSPADTSQQPVSKLDRFFLEAGHRRERRATSGQQEEVRQELELLTFVLSGEQYAVEIEKIVQIIDPRPFTRVPNADPFVVGIISLRGTIVTLLDIRKFLGHAEQKAREPRIIIFEQHHQTLGFTVDTVLRVVRIDPAVVEAHPIVHSSEHDETIRGVFRQDDALTIFLDLDKLLDAGRQASLATTEDRQPADR